MKGTVRSLRGNSPPVRALENMALVGSYFGGLKLRVKGLGLRV